MVKNGFKYDPKKIAYGDFSEYSYDTVSELLRKNSGNLDAIVFANDKMAIGGYKAIVDGETDILFCAAPSEEQKKYAEEKGVELVYVPVGLEAFVFFVNENKNFLIGENNEKDNNHIACRRGIAGILCRTGKRICYLRMTVLKNTISILKGEK